MRAGGSYGDRSQKLCCNESEDPPGRAQTCRGLGCWATRARADPGTARAGRSPTGPHVTTRVRIWTPAGIIR